MVDSKTAQYSGKRAWTNKQGKAERFADSTAERYLSTNIGFPTKEVQYTLDTDAYDHLLTCVLLQKQDDNVDKPIGRWSKIMTDRARNIDTIYRECLTVVFAILLLQSYLKATKSTVQTDPPALK